MFSELPREIHIFETTMNLEFLENKFGVLNYNSVCGTLFDRNLHSESDGVLILIKGICVSVSWNKRNFFLYDSHSKDKQGESSPNGAATLIKFNSIKALEVFIIQSYLNENDKNIQYELQYITVKNDNNASSATYLAYRNRIRRATPCKRKKLHV